MPKRMPTQTPVSSEATETLDDVLEGAASTRRAATRAAPTRNWTANLNPLTLRFWKAMDKNAWDVVSGFYEGFRPYREPTADEKSEAFHSARKEGKSIEEAIEAIPSIKWQIPAVLSNKEPQKHNWTTILASLNPTSLRLWKSLDKSGWDTLESFYELGRFYREPTADEKSEAFHSALKEGKSIEEAIEAIPSIKWQIPAIVPVAQQIGKEILIKVSGKGDEEDTPMIDGIADHAVKATGAGALFGDDAAKQEFYKFMYNDPAGFWGWYLPWLTHLKAVRGTGMVSKTLRATANVAEVVDSPAIGGASAINKSILRYRYPRLPADTSKAPSKVKRGQDLKTGKAVESTVTEEATRQKYDEILTRADQRSWSIESFDIKKVGDALLEAYEGGQYGLHSGFQRKYDVFDQVLIQPLKLGDDFELLAKTNALLNELRTTRVAKPMSDLEVEIVDNTLAQTFDEIAGAAKGNLRIEDIDALRFRFRKRVKDALQKEGLYETGYSNLVQKVYTTLTEDFYDLVENEVRRSPEKFPKNLIDDITQAKADYQRIAALADSAAARLIHRNYDAPHKLVTHILNGKSTHKSIADMKTLLGDEMWGQLQAGFLQRLFEGTGRKTEFTWDGLKRKIDSINAKDANRLRLIFGDERAKELAEFGEWSAKFASKGATMKFINKFIAEDGQLQGMPLLPDLLHRLVDIVDFGGTGVKPKAVSVTTAVVGYFSGTPFQEYFESEEGRSRLKGRQWKVVTKDDEVITITPDDFTEAIERLKTREQGQLPKRNSSQKKQQRKSTIGGGPPIRLTPFVH